MGPPTFATLQCAHGVHRQARNRGEFLLGEPRPFAKRLELRTERRWSGFHSSNSYGRVLRSCASKGFRSVRHVDGEKKFTCIVSSPYHDPAGHLRMNGTEIGVRARRRESERELLVGIQYLRLEHLVRAHH